MKPLTDRVLIHSSLGKRHVVEPADVYFLEAVEGGTRIRMRGTRAGFDVRPIGLMEQMFSIHGFMRIHRNHMVNLRRVREIRRRGKGREWEVKLEPPVNRVLPISREALGSLWAAFGEE